MMNDETYLQIAYVIAQQSKCVSWAVGAVIVKDGRIIATGYNGSPSGHKNCCDHAQENGWLIHKDGVAYLKKESREAHSSWSDRHETHAEINAIAFAAKNGVSIDGATMYVTLSPCQMCSKTVAQTGISRVVYGEYYDRNSEDWDYTLRASNIQVDQCIMQKPVLNMDLIRSFKGQL